MNQIPELRKPNGIESSNDINCGTCSLMGRCRYIRNKHYSNRVNYVCRYYCNPDKGCYNDSGKKKVEG